MTDWLVSPAKEPLAGDVQVPPDKSISHRILLFAALSSNRSDAVVSRGQDVGHTLQALQQLGVSITDGAPPGDPQLRPVKVSGVGMRGLVKPDKELYLGNSGTSMRLLAGLLCGANIEATLVGDESLMRRPMMRIVEPLRQMGADIECCEDGTPPLRIRPTNGPMNGLSGITYRLPVASAQVKSAILLAGLYAKGTTTVIESAADRSRDHTERMLGYLVPDALRIEEQGDDRIIRIQQSSETKLRPVEVWKGAGDFSSAAFPLVASALCSGARVEIFDIGINETRAGLLKYLGAMGAAVQKAGESPGYGEPSADLMMCGPGQLKACTVCAADGGLADVIDEIPALAMAMACAEGVSTLKGAGELRHKESDRIAAICRGLEALGITVQERDDGFEITGIGTDGLLPVNSPVNSAVNSVDPVEIDSFGDHRIAMAFTCLAPRLSVPIRIRGCESVATSFPSFVAEMKKIGVDITTESIQAESIKAEPIKAESR